MYYAVVFQAVCPYCKQFLLGIMLDPRLACLELARYSRYYHHRVSRILRSTTHLSIHNKQMDASDSAAVTLHVGGLTRNVREAHLVEVFSCFGSVKAVELQTSKGLSKGFAYVHFNSSLDAEAAVLAMDGGQLDGAVLKVSFILVQPRRRRDSPPPGTIYIHAQIKLLDDIF